MHHVVLFLQLSPGTATSVSSTQDADDHGERVVVDVTGLDVADQPANQPTSARRAVDEEAVDHRDVADTSTGRVPSARAPPAKNQSLKRSKPYFSVQDASPEARTARADLRRQVRLHEIQVPGSRRRPPPPARTAAWSSRAASSPARRGIPRPASPSRRARGTTDGIAEIVAEQTAADQPAGADRRNGEQDQRQGHHPRRFVRRAVWPWSS